MTDVENDVLDAGETYAAAWAELQRRKQEGWPFDRLRPLYLCAESAKDAMACAALRAAGHPVDDLHAHLPWVE